MINDFEIESLRAHAQMERKAAIDAAEKQYAASISAIELVNHMVKNKKSPMKLNLIPAALSPTNTDVAAAGPMALIRQAVEQQTGAFTVQDIYLSVKNAAPGKPVNRNTLSGAMWKLLSKKEIEVVEPGSGRKPNLYKRKVSA